MKNNKIIINDLLPYRKYTQNEALDELYPNLK